MNETILLVDDNPGNLAVLFDHLDKLGYEILVTDNGIDAVEQSAESIPNLILLDVRMPGMDGYETCRAIKANQALIDVPIIFISALGDTDDRLKGFSAGGVDYITKPIQVEEVAARMQTHLKLARVQQELSAANEQLEALVQERTKALDVEVQNRQQQEREKASLVSLLSINNQQLYQLTSQILETYPNTQLAFSQVITESLVRQVKMISEELKAATTLPIQPTATHNSTLDHIQTALSHAKQLESYLQVLITNASAQISTKLDESSQRLESLTDRERDILSLLADGHSAVEIGNKLQISHITVRTYRSRIMRKLKITHLAGLVKFALKHNLTTLNV